MRRAISAAALLILAATSAPAQTVVDKRPDGTNGNPITDQMTCVISAPNLYGPSTPATGVGIFTFQLVDGGMGLINGRFVKPYKVEIDGFHSTASFTVESFDIDPKSAAMSTLLKDSEREALRKLMAFKSRARTNGLTRILFASFPDRTAYIYSLRDGEEVDTALEYCE